MRDYNIKVGDVPYRLGGTQSLTTPTGEIFSLRFVNGLPYLKMRRPTNDEINGGLTQIMMSSDAIWDPSKYTNDFDEEEQRKSLPTIPKGTDDNYDDRGEIIF